MASDSLVSAKDHSMAKKKSATKKASGSKTTKSAKKKSLKDPSGGLTAAGRAAFKKKEGSNLKPGVKGKADTPQKMKRKGSFLRRHFADPRGPMQDENGEPTRLALSAHAWGEPVPKTKADAKKLAEKGSKLLERYQKTQDSDTKSATEKSSTKSAKQKKSSR